MATLALTAVKVSVFVALMLVVGRRVIPWVMHYVAHTGSRELFRLAVLAIALGVAFASAKLFGVSFALGAFFAGMVLAESELSHQAARETLPLRDAFAVLFFVSVGMLFDPAILTAAPLAVVATCLIIIVGKSLAAFLIVRAFGHPDGTALTISASLAQIGEFSFILIVLGVALGIVPDDGRDLVVAGAIVSIIANPLLFRLVDRWDGAARRAPAPVATREPPKPEPAAAAPPRSGHVVVIGHGRVGSQIVADLLAGDAPLLVVDETESAVAALRTAGADVLVGTPGEPAMIDRLDLAGARTLVVAIPDPYEAGHLVEVARAANPDIHVVARAHSAEAADYLRSLGADVVLVGEEELGRGMARAVAEEPAPAPA